MRSSAIRIAAKKVMEAPFHYTWLGTTYHDEEAHELLVDHVEDWPENMCQDGTILNDYRYYDWSDQWQRILDVLPEVLHS